MLESLRAIQNTAAGKIILTTIMGLIVISFVIWGVGPVFQGFNANQLASVGDNSVSTEDFQRAYQLELQQVQQQTRRPITNAEAHQYGLDTQVLSRLVSEAVLDHQAHGLGLSISDQQIAKSILTDPTFKGANGDFDKARFAELLRDNDLTEQGFVRDQRKVYLRQELMQGLVGDIKVPQAALEAMNRYQTETRSIDYIVLPQTAAGTIAKPDDATLKKFFDDRAPSYRAPEYRKVVILPLTPKMLAKPNDVSDADVAKLYDTVKGARFTDPEYRTLQQIVFPNEQEAAAAAQRIKGGASFDDVAKDRKLADKDTDLGRITKASIFDKTIADAAFALPEGGTSEPVKNAFGAVLVHVVKIDPAVVKPLADVAADLRTEIAATRATDRIRTLHDKVEDARASGQPLAAAAKTAGLETRSIDALDASGRDKAGTPVPDLPDAAPLLKAIYASDVGVDNDTVSTPDGGQIFFEIASVEPGRQQSFDEVKAKVEAAWTQDQITKALTKKADELVKAVDGGQTLEQVAASLGGNLAVQHSADVRRNGASGLGAPLVAQVFNLPVDKVGTAPGDHDTRVVFKVLGSVVPPIDPDAPQIGQLRNQYQSWIAEDALSAYMTGVQDKIGVRINPQAFKAVIGSDS